MKRYWISWEEGGADYRPETDPPNKAILGWWCSGYTTDNDAVLCAVVDSENEDAAAAAVKQDWPAAPGVSVWRHFQEMPSDWTPGDRFPLSDWMVERFTKF